MFKLQIRTAAGWSTIFEGAQGFCSGYMAARANDPVRNEFRVTRTKDGKVMESLSAASEPGLGMSVDFPPSRAYIEAAVKALARATRGLEEPSRATVLRVLEELKALVAAIA